MRDAVRFFCAAFDDDWVLFSYLLLSQHRYLRQRDESLASPIKVLRRALSEAMARGEIPRAEPEFLSAMLMGLVLQTAVSKIYGRLEGAMLDYADPLSSACWRVVAQSGEEPRNP